MPITWLTVTDPVHGLDEPREVPHSNVLNVGEKEATASVELMCDFADRFAVLENIIASGLVWPYRTEYGLRAVSGAVLTFNGEQNTEDGSGNSFGLAVLRINFRTADYDSENEQLYSESIEPTLEFMTLPYGNFRWGAADGPALLPEEAPGRMQVGLDYCVTLYNLASIPAEALTLIGKVNTGDVSSPSLGLTFAAETLLFNPPTISRNVAFGEANRYTMTIRFTCRPTGWNKFWRADTMTWVDIYVAGGAVYKNFPATSFAGVLP